MSVHGGCGPVAGSHLGRVMVKAVFCSAPTSDGSSCVGRSMASFVSLFELKSSMSQVLGFNALHPIHENTAILVRFGGWEGPLQCACS